MTVRLDLNGLLANAVGGDGVTPDELSAAGADLSRVREELGTRRAAGTLAFADLPHRRNDLALVRETANAVRGEFDTLVVGMDLLEGRSFR